MKHTILVAAHDAGIAGQLRGALAARYRVRIAVGMRDVLQALGEGQDELLLLHESLLDDAEAPALRALLTGADGPGIAVMMAGQQGDDVPVSEALRATILQGRVAMHFGMQYELAALGDVASLAFAASALGTETEAHCRRTQHYVRRLAEAVRDVPRWRRGLGAADIALMFHAAPFHDIGKAGIPACILKKPGRLTPAEFTVMQQHTSIGYGVAVRATMLAGAGNRLLGYVRDIARCHHERWDGTGYPAGLAGEQIPLAARLMAIADVYDALISRRVYKEAMPQDEAVQRIAAGRGQQFDPCLVDAFLDVAGNFADIAQRFTDAPAGSGTPLATCL